jgi:hypothetical protein
VNVKTIDGPTWIDLGDGTNTVQVGTNVGGAGSVVSGIAAFLDLVAGTGNDTLVVDDTATPDDRIGVVSRERITGLGMRFHESAAVPTGQLALPDLVQVLRIPGAIEGRFRFSVTIAGQVLTTRELDFDATARDVREALEALPGFAGNVVVTKVLGTWVIAYVNQLAGAAGWERPLAASTGQIVIRDGDGTALQPDLTRMSDGWIRYVGFQNLTLRTGTGNDLVYVDDTPGPTTISTGDGHDVVMVEKTRALATVQAGRGDDVLVVNPIVVPGEPNALGGDLTLDGGHGSDYYVVGLWGNGDRRIDVVDSFRPPTGAETANPDGDTNVLVVNGSADDDTFLFRKDLIAQLSDKRAGAFRAAELVVYGATINGGVIVNGGDGDDTFAFDDTSTGMEVNGDGGNDRFSVGQIVTNYVPHGEFGIPGGQYATQSPLFTDDPRFRASFFPSTRGWLTNGVSHPVTINGGTGDDLFDIVRNRGVLTLNGEDGDDTFIVRTFVSYDELTKVSSGGGRDLIQYVMNAPVAIDGGDGYDTVVIVGTEFADDFVITKDGVYGAGRFVSYLNIERLVIDGMEGDDRFFVQSTNPNVETRIVGGLGSDTVVVAGHAPTVQADDLLGHSGIVTHSVESTGGTWSTVPVDGIAADVIDVDADSVVIVPPSGGVVVREGPTSATGLQGSFQVYLSRAPAAGQVVAVTVQAPAVNAGSTTRFRGVQLSTDGKTWSSSVTLTFTAGGPTAAQTVLVRAITDNASEGERSIVLQTSINAALTTATSWHGVQVASTLVRVLDRDAAGVVVTPPAGGIRVVEPHTVSATVTRVEGSTATYTLSLNRAPLTTIRILIDPGPELTASVTEVVFTPTSWAAVTITLTAVNDGKVEGTHFGYVTHTIAQANGQNGDLWTGLLHAVPGPRSELVVNRSDLPVLTDYRNLRGYLLRIVTGAAAGQYRRIFDVVDLGGPTVLLLLETGLDRLPVAGDGWVISGYTPPPSLGFIGGTVTAVVGNVITLDPNGTPLPTGPGALSGAIVRIVDGSGPGVYRRIASNTAWTITTVDAFPSSAVGAQIAVLGLLGVDIDRLAAVIADSDTPGVIITPTGGGTRVVEGGAAGNAADLRNDTYTVRLTRAPEGTVRIWLTPQATPTAYFVPGTGFIRGTETLVLGGAAQWDATSGRYYLDFTSTNWWVPQVVVVSRRPRTARATAATCSPSRRSPAAPTSSRARCSSSAASTPTRPTTPRSRATCRSCCRASPPPPRSPSCSPPPESTRASRSTG